MHTHAVSMIGKLWIMRSVTRMVFVKMVMVKMWVSVKVGMMVEMWMRVRSGIERMVLLMVMMKCMKLTVGNH
jgi:hypothetical protein